MIFTSSLTITDRGRSCLNRVLPRSEVFSSPGVYAWVNKRLPTEAPLMGLRATTSIANPAVNGWASGNLIKQHQSQTSHGSRATSCTQFLILTGAASYSFCAFSGSICLRIVYWFIAPCLFFCSMKT